MKTKLIILLSVLNFVTSCGVKEDMNNDIVSGYANCTSPGSCEISEELITDKDSDSNNSEESSTEENFTNPDELILNEDKVVSINKREGIITIEDENGSTIEVPMIEKISTPKEHNYPIVNSDEIELTSTLGEELFIPREDSAIEPTVCQKKTRTLRGIIFEISSLTKLVAISKLRKFKRKKIGLRA